MAKLSPEKREMLRRLSVSYSNRKLSTEIFGKDVRICCLAIARAMEGKPIYPKFIGPIEKWIESKTNE